jgi:hypothetical protein
MTPDFSIPILSGEKLILTWSCEYANQQRKDSLSGFNVAGSIPSVIGG